MATRSCPQCGAQYVASVRRCIDCDVALADDRPATDEAAPASVPLAEGDRVAFELDGWGNQLKVSLEGMLDNAGIRRLWEVGALVVSADDADAVEALVATVEGRDVEELVEMEEQLAFEIEGLDAEDVAELDARLIAAGIVHAWSEEGDLLVSLDDEDRVTEIVEAVVEGDSGDDEVDGLAANQVLSDLYVVLDRLVKAPEDHKLVTRLNEAAAPLADMGVPYGFAAREWTDLKAEVVALVELCTPTFPDERDLDADPGDDADADADAAAPDAADQVDTDPDDAEGDNGAETGSESDAGTDPDLDPDEQVRLAVERLRERLLAWV